MAETITQSSQLAAFATRAGAEFKTVYTQLGTLASLKTTDKTSFVNAINEVVDSVTAAQKTIAQHTTDISAANESITTLNDTLSTVKKGLEDLKTQVEAATNIDDANVGTTTTYSSKKISDEITAAKSAVKNELLNGAGAAYDTLKELGDLIDSNKSAIEALQDIAAGHVRFDAAQTLTDTQKKQARDNIGAGTAADVTSHATRLSAVEKKASDNATAIADFKAAVGDTTTDYVAAFEAALAATE